MACNHVLIGDKNGVHCDKCGMVMTAKEYLESRKKPAEAKKTTRRTAKKEVQK